MKKCKKCGKELDESFFLKEKGYKDGLKSICKDCANFYCRNYSKPNFPKIWSEFKGCEDYEKEQELKIMESVGGYKIYILNHVKKGEFKYNVISTIGTTFKSNDVNEFHKKIKEVLCLR